MRVGSGVILFQLAGFLTSALADFYFAKHTYVGVTSIICYKRMRYIVRRRNIRPSASKRTNGFLFIKDMTLVFKTSMK